MKYNTTTEYNVMTYVRNDLWHAAREEALPGIFAVLVDTPARLGDEEEGFNCEAVSHSGIHAPRSVY